MAKKGRLKRRKAPREHPPQSKITTVSSDDSNPIPSARQSSVGTLSEHATSDDAQTSMTSIMDTDEDHADGPQHQNDHTIEVDDDIASIYPVTHYYPRASSSHRTEMPFSRAGQVDSPDMGASTRSLWAQDLDYRDIHGRRYCQEYYMPIDEIEQLRMTLIHQVLLQVLDGELTLAPLNDPTHILDIGTGTGEWAIKVAELYPDCEVVGTDIAAIAETSRVPMNVFFEIEDAEDWDREPDMYDMIHFRCMEGAFSDWTFMYDSAFYSLKPGGWIEAAGFDLASGLGTFYSQFAEDSPVHALARDLAIASDKVGRQIGTSHLEPRLFMDCGYADVRVTEYVVPITVADKSVGKIWLIACLDAMEAMCLRLLTEQMGWDADECKAACETAARELANIAKDPVKSKDLVMKLQIVVARKPFDAPLSLRTGDTRSPSAEPMKEDASQITEHGACHEASSSSQTGLVSAETGPDAALTSAP